MKNKKSVMAFAALQIMIFHLWVYLFPGSQIEKFLKETSYIGVDVFFFLSAYSMATKDIDKYWKFELSRFNAVYLKFILLAIVAFVCKRQKIKTLVFNILGVNFIKKGGGSFLWFAPAIMVMYLLIPFLQKAYKKNAKLTFILTILSWAVAGILISVLTDYNAIFIFFNRIPVILLGFYLGKSDNIKKIVMDTRLSLLIGGLLLIIGEILVYLFAYKAKLMVPVYEMFYVCVIPASLGIIFVISQIPENKVIKLIGSATLEMYGLQMIFGYKIAQGFLKAGLMKVVVNILTIVCLVVLSVIISKIYDFIRKQIKKIVVS